MKLIQIKTETHQSLKVLAVSQSLSMKELTEKILSEYLKRKGGEK